MEPANTYISCSVTVTFHRIGTVSDYFWNRTRTSAGGNNTGRLVLLEDTIKAWNGRTRHMQYHRGNRWKSKIPCR